MKISTLKIEGLKCKSCALGLERAFKKDPMIDDAGVDIKLEKAVIKYENEYTVDDLEKIVNSVGFAIEKEDPEIKRLRDEMTEKAMKKRSRISRFFFGN
ncbi:MAG: heavy metal-associated domain-containing protein [Clostridia bacterium]